MTNIEKTHEAVLTSFDSKLDLEKYNTEYSLNLECINIFIYVWITFIIIIDNSIDVYIVYTL